MRELKFRQFIGGQWHFWGMQDDGSFTGPSSLTSGGGIAPSQQATGLTDAKGVAIWEGDVVHIRKREWNEAWTVEYDDTIGAFVVYNQLNSLRCFVHDFAMPESPLVVVSDDYSFKPEVLGDIWANPELLAK